MAEVSFPGTEEPIELPASRDSIFDPPPGLAWLREHQPIRRIRFPDGTIGWMVTGHALTQQLLTEDRLRKDVAWPEGSCVAGGHPVPTELPSEKEARLAPRPPESEESARVRHLIEAINIIDLEPPRHTEVRSQMAPFFSVKRIATLRPDADDAVRTVCDEMESIGPPVDFVAVAASRIPLLMLSRLIGVDSDVVAPNTDAASYAEPGEWVSRITAAIEPAIRARRIDHGPLIAQLASSRLTDDEAVGAGAFLAPNVVGTTAEGIGAAVFALLAHPGEWDRLVANHDLVDGVTDELMRYLTIAQRDASIREASEDFEIAGETIRAGEWVYTSLQAANRDPRAFPDPDRLDVGRDASGHVAFGYGRHQCIGQNLVRLEVEATIRGLVERFPGLRLAVPANEVPMPPGNAHISAPSELMVEW